MFRCFLIFISLLIGLNAFSQGANSTSFELVSRVYFGTPPYDVTDIMNPPVGTVLFPCTGYSDYTLGNSNNGDGNVAGLEYVTGVLRNETYDLEVEGGFCGSTPSVSNPNRAIKVYVDFDASGTYESTELVYTSPYSNNNNPIFNTSITIPNDAALGPITMRIVYNRVGAFTALWQVTALNWAINNFQYGETEDYTLIVTGYVDSISSTSTTCYNTSDGQIQIIPDVTAPATTEYSINGLAGPWTTNLIYTNLAVGDYDVWARDSDLAPNYVYEALQTTVVSSDTVFVNPQITSDYNGSEISCNGNLDGEITLSASGGDDALYTYQYSSTSNPIITDALANPLTNLGADTYTFIATDAQGCTSLPTDIEITEPSPVVIDAVVVDQPPSCNTSCDAIITIDASGGTPAYSYNVDGVDNGNNNTVNGVCSGLPLLTVTDDNGCFTQSNPLIPNPADLDLTVNITSDFSSFPISCQDSTDGTIEVSTLGGSGGEYSYSIDGGLTFPYASIGALDITNLSEGSYSVIAVDSNLCESLPQDIILNAPTPLSFDFITTITPISCNGFSDGEISLLGEDGVGAYIYSIDGGATTQTSGDFTSLTAGTYEFTVIDDNNCSYNEFYDLNQPSELSIVSATVTSDYNGSQVSCFGASDAIITVDFDGGNAPYSYNLVPDPTVFPLAANNLITNLSAGLQTLQAIDFNGCVSTPLPFEITEPNDLLISDINLVNNVSCFGGSDGEITITANGGSGGYTYFVDALYSSANQAPYTVGGLSFNTYNVVVTDANNCTSPTVAQAITQPDQILSNLSVVNLGCDGDYGSAAVNPVGGTPNYSISWSTGATGNSVDQLTSGAYSVTIIDALSCQETIDFQITEPNISLSVNPILCYGNGNGEIQATLNNPNPSSNYSVLWDDANAQITNTASGLSSGTYTVTMTDQFGCVLTASETINEPDSLNIFVEHTQLCLDAPIASALVFASGGLTPYDYLWSTNETSELISIQTAGMYSVQVNDFNNCQHEVAITIDPIVPVQLNFVTQAVSCVDNTDGSVEVFATGGYDPYTFEWSNYTQAALNDGVSSGNYAVTVTDNNGCVYYDEIEVPSSNQSCITAYSAFSPNGDQNNDYWHIDNIELYPDALVEVFNRWGDRVYSTKKYINAWEGAWQGMYESMPLPSATYYYVITLNNDEPPIAGTVTIVR
jgi:gliding motility-associated-like protein